MTTTSDAAVRCPVCGAAGPIALDTGLRFCPFCQTEYDPADPPAPMVAAPIDLERVPLDHPDHAGLEVVAGLLEAQRETVDDVLGPPLEVLDDDVPAEVADLIGAEIVLDDGRHALVRGFPDDDHVTVELPTGRKTTVAFESVLGRADATVAGGVTIIDLDDDAARKLAGATAAIAAVTLRAGVTMLVSEGDGWVFAVPPTGWLPDDLDGLALVEQGVAYAIATLIAALEIPVDEVTHIVDRLLEQAQATDESGGVTSE